ncbi:MAG: biopolymer transporter ExbD [Nitrospirae bacterium]|nr:biopolymer transporter ExbD [Nitrospirota bacterium]
MIRVPTRVKRHTNKVSAGTGLNLISLMDILTTLVFFLLIHVTNDVETVQVPGNVSLPASFSTVKPTPGLTVFITSTEILVEDKKIARIQDVLSSGESSIEGLEKELLIRVENDKQTSKTGHKQDNKPDNKKEKKITIMGDKDLPFTLLKKIMNTCSRAGYSTITLAVLQKDAL